MVTVPVTPAVLCNCAINIGHVFEVNSKIGNWITSIIFLMSSLRCSYCIRICSTILCLFRCCRTCTFTVGSTLRSSLASKASVTVEPSAAYMLCSSAWLVGSIETFESVGAVLSNVTELPEVRSACVRAV